jgi:hypothetical protein
MNGTLMEGSKLMRAGIISDIYDAHFEQEYFILSTPTTDLGA